jgi:hypothetical protein
MDAIATEEWARMVRRRMPYLRVGIPSPPRQDGSAVNDQVTGANEPTADGALHCQDKQRLAYRGSSSLLTLPLLGRRGDTWLTKGVER